MTLDREAIFEVSRRTQVVRAPKQALATFGVTSITYYLLTEPVYSEFSSDSQETVVRRGKVMAERPQLVTPFYLLNMFRGFEHAEEYSRYLIKAYGREALGLLYQYHNELLETSVVSELPLTVAGRLSDQLERDGENLAAVIKGVDHLWDVSLMKFIYELTSASLGHNVGEMSQMGLLAADGRLPRAARLRIEEMFAAVARGELDPSELKAELDRWEAFDEYEDRFLAMFRRK